MTGQLNSSEPEQPARLQHALTYYAAFIVLGLIASAWGPNLLALAEQTGSTLSQISILFAGNALGYIVGSLFGGWLYDRRRGHPILIITLGMLALLLFTLPFAPSRLILVLIALLLGIGMGILDVGGNTLIVWLFGHDVDPYMTALHLAYSLGAFISPVLIDRVIGITGGIRWAYWLLALLIVPIIFWLARLPSPLRPAPLQENADTPALRRYTPLIAMLVILFFLHVGTQMAYGSWIFSYAVASGVGSDTMARLLNSAYWGAVTLSRLIAIPLALKLRPKTMLLLDLLGAVASIALLVFLPAWPPAIWIASFGLGFSVATMFPATVNFTERRMPITGQVTSLFLVGANAGAMTLSWFIGQLFASAGPQSMIWTLTGTLTLALLLFIIIVWYTREVTEVSLA